MVFKSRLPLVTNLQCVQQVLKNYKANVVIKDKAHRKVLYGSYILL